MISIRTRLDCYMGNFWKKLLKETLWACLGGRHTRFLKPCHKRLPPPTLSFSQFFLETVHCFDETAQTFPASLRGYIVERDNGEHGAQRIRTWLTHFCLPRSQFASASLATTSGFSGNSSGCIHVSRGSTLLRAIRLVEA